VGGNPLIINQIQSSTQTLDESSFVKIESIPETPENEKYLASLGLDLKSASAGNLPNGAKVLILAYKKIKKIKIRNKKTTYTYF